MQRVHILQCVQRSLRNKLWFSSYCRLYLSRIQVELNSWRDVLVWHPVTPAPSDTSCYCCSHQKFGSLTSYQNLAPPKGTHEQLLCYQSCNNVREILIIGSDKRQVITVVSFNTFYFNTVDNLRDLNLVISLLIHTYLLTVAHITQHWAHGLVGYGNGTRFAYWALMGTYFSWLLWTLL